MNMANRSGKEDRRAARKRTALKFFLPLYCGLMALVVAVSFIVYRYETTGGRELTKLNERLRLGGLEREIRLNIQSVISDLLVLAEDDEFTKMLESGSESAMWTITEDFRSFVKRKGNYDQIRFLDIDGMEVIRVNREGDGRPYVVPGESLQNKADRYYFSDTMALKVDQVYMSPLDLNVEHGTVEMPYKPIIRFGTAIHDKSGHRGGALLINYLAGGFLDGILNDDEAEISDTYLLNSGGYILQGPVQEKRWGFMFDNGKDWTFANQFPEIWTRVSGGFAGQVMDDGDLFTFKQIMFGTGLGGGTDLIRKLEQGDWYIVSRIPREILHAGYAQIQMWLSVWVSILAVALAGVCWLLAAIRIKHIVAEEKIRQSLVEKDVLLREIHHRVKNNLQVISGMLELQAALVTDSAARTSLKEGRNRVMSMALIHQKLYQSEDIALIHMASYLQSLAGDLFSAYGVDKEKVSLKVEAEAVRLNLDTAIPFGLLVSELVTNAIKYAFPPDHEDGKGEVAISFRELEDGNYSLTVSDSGVGLPEEFDLDTAASLGLKLVHTLVEQLGGEVTLTPPPGTTWTISCPPYQGAEGAVDPPIE